MKRMEQGWDPRELDPDFEEYDDDAYYCEAPSSPGFFKRLMAWLLTGGRGEETRLSAPPPPGGAGARGDVEEALKQWKAATAYFESVSDPALVDYAIFGMEAAEKRYMYLLRNACGKKPRAPIQKERTRSGQFS